MKQIYCLLFFVAVSFQSCNSKSNTDNKATADTLLLKFTEYDRNKFDRYVYRTLIKSEKSYTIVFEYYDSSGIELHDRFVILKNSRNELDLISHNHLIQVKNYKVFDSLLFSKFEIKDPFIDGDGGYLISETYGDFGGYCYTWGNSGFLKQWGTLEFPDSLHQVLMTDSISFPHYYYYGEGRGRK